MPLKTILLSLAPIWLGAPLIAGETYCNPLDLDYKYTFEEQWRNISYRSGADPVLLQHEGGYLLFSTIAGGYWRSKDLMEWRHVKPAGWPEKDMVAPAALSAKGKVWLLQSTYETRPIYVLNDPFGTAPKLEVYNDQLPYLPGALGPWDPAFFYDEEKDEWHLYVGSSNLFPIYGIRLDESKRLNYVRHALEMIVLRPELHGWERFGRDHRETIKPFMEGAWVTKHREQYYLQYGAPGTEHNVYANGTYVSEKPLGPWTYQAHNPVSYKPGGFVNGAGHGNTFQDKHGNYWNTGTPWIAVNYDFERRIAMFPAGFDKDGIMYGNNWKAMVDLRGEKRDRPNAYFELVEPVRARFVRYEHVYVASPNLAISDIRVFGNTGGEPPAVPQKFTVRRDTDERNAHVTWEDVEGAVGYNVLWGIAPDKLYSCYQVWGDQRPRLEVRALTVKQKYSFAIEAFNESGVSQRSEVVNVE